MDLPGAIGTWLCCCPEGNVLIEAGPARTIPRLVEGLAEHELTLEDLDACLLTHIHLDHAGAAGHLARLGVPIYVHEFGVRHIIDPSKLLSSAARIYGSAMDQLWGETVPAPESHVHPLVDDQIIEVGDIRLRAIETPGHARHHHAFELDRGDETICFSGDAAAMLIPETNFISIPSPPPEFDLHIWLDTLDRLRNGSWSSMYLTHGGIVNAESDHLDRLEAGLKEQVEWMKSYRMLGLEGRERAIRYRQDLLEQAQAQGVTEGVFDDYVSEHLLGMNIAGMERWITLQEQETGH